jgi:hypothetical protein
MGGGCIILTMTNSLLRPLSSPTMPTKKATTQWIGY